MNKTFLRFGALTLVSMMGISSFAQDIIIKGDLRYRVLSESTVSVQNVDKSTTVSVEIPASITDNGVTYTVTSVDNYAFQNTSVTSVKVYADLKSIGTHAFSTGKSTTIEFNTKFAPESIGDYAFYSAGRNTLDLKMNKNKDNILDLSAIPDGTTSVGNGVFEYVTFKVDSEDSPAVIKVGHFTSIPKEMFQNVSSNSTNGSFILELPLDSKLQRVEDSAFLHSALVAFGYNNQGEYYLPGTLNAVETHAFSSTHLCDNYEGFGYSKCMQFSAFDPESKIKEVGQYAFAASDVTPYKWLDNNRFENLFGSFETLIYGTGSFANCNLTSVDLSKAKMLNVPSQAFSGNPLNDPCIELVYGDETLMTSVKLHPKCNSIGEAAFQGPTENPTENDISVLDIPATVTNIGNYAFQHRKVEYTFIRVDEPFIIGNASSIPTTDALYVPAKYDVVPAFKAGNNWAGFEYTQFLPDYTNGNILYKGIINSDLNYCASGYIPNEEDASADVTILDEFTCEPLTKFGYTFNGGNVTKVNSIFATREAKAQIKSVKFETSEITTVPVMKSMAKLETVVLNGNIEALPKNVFQNDVLLTSVNLEDTKVTVLPDNAFNGASALEKIDLDKITKIGKYAFSECKSLENVKLSESRLETVDEGAFYNSALAEVTIPAAVTTIGSKAFNTQSLLKVNVSYDEATKIPVIDADAFYKETTKGVPRYNLYKAVLHVENLDREAYLAKKNWKLFFAANGVSVKVNGEPLAANENDVFVLEDGVESVSINKAATVGVEYVRDFTSTAWQCWFVPFDIKVGDVKGVRFAQIYDTKQTENGTIIEYKELEEGDIVYANKPYVVKPAAVGELTFTANSIYATTDADENYITVSDIVNTYKFTGTYEKMAGPAEWYGLNASKGNFAKAGSANAYINAYRFYMEIDARTDNPYAQPAPASTVKFVVLGDEDATGISDINTYEIANGAMFDLQGRKINAPVKGQVYIQNGVKKLAK